MHLSFSCATACVLGSLDVYQFCGTLCSSRIHRTFIYVAIPFVRDDGLITLHVNLNKLTCKGDSEARLPEACHHDGVPM